MNFVIFILFVAYLVYNGIQVMRAMSGVRFESIPFLFFLAAPYDFYTWVKSKL